MNWFFAAFFGVAALCAVIYLWTRLRDRMAPRKECEAVVEKRYSENFPMTMGFIKRDRTERHLALLTDAGSALDFMVDEELYKRCPAGTRGRLIYQGGRLVRFDVMSLPEDDNC